MRTFFCTYEKMTDAGAVEIQSDKVRAVNYHDAMTQSLLLNEVELPAGVPVRLLIMEEQSRKFVEFYVGQAV